MLNSTLKAFPSTSAGLDKDSLIRKARKATGLYDLGSDFNDEPLERLLSSINEEARLHPVGRFITRERMAGLIAIRLRAEAFFKKYPQILEQELYPAWVIVGLQRTGTTKLQRLLAEDPDHRVIPSWEVINPVPVQPDLYSGILSKSTGTGVTGGSSGAYPSPRDKRIGIARMSVNAVKWMSPGFFAVHPISVTEPEEDILMLDVSFMSTTPEAMMHVPSYATWLERTDQSEAYAYAVKLLKFLQWIRPAKRWVLKSPHHLEFTGVITKFFPDVHFLWPHRTLEESIPSFLSMVTYNRMIFSDRVDVGEITDHWVRKVGYMLNQALAHRQGEGNERYYTDMDYRSLIRDSIGELQKIYRLNGGLTSELADRFRQHEEEHPHRKHGTHHYSLDDFGLTAGRINAETSHYYTFFSEHYAGEQS